MIVYNMNESKNLYDILGVKHNASHEEIKQAYKKLCILHHPDKNYSHDTTDKYIDIQNAYEILTSDRKKYDEMDDKDSFYDSLKKVIKSQFSNYDNYVKLIFGTEYNAKRIIDECDVPPFIVSMLNKIAKNVDIDDLHIIGTINATHEEKFNDKYRIVDVKRKTKPNIKIKVPLRLKIYKLLNEGEYDYVSKNSGDIVINVSHDLDILDENIVVNDYDICVKKVITLYEYLYTDDIEIQIFNKMFSTKINKNYSVIENEGMLIDDEGRKGNIYVYFEIKDLKKFEPCIKKLCY
jgi:DnaJ-class molecular chaperone